MYPQAGSTLGIEVPGHDDLISGNIRTQPLLVAAGTYVRGEIIEIDTATDKLGKLTTAANAAAVIPSDVTLAADAVIAVYTGGDFNQDAVDLNGAPLAPVKTALRDRGIMLREWGAAPDAV